MLRLQPIRLYLLSGIVNACWDRRLCLLAIFCLRSRMGERVTVLYKASHTRRPQTHGHASTCPAITVRYTDCSSMMCGHANARTNAVALSGKTLHPCRAPTLHKAHAGVRQPARPVHLCRHALWPVSHIKHIRSTERLDTLMLLAEVLCALSVSGFWQELHEQLAQPQQVLVAAARPNDAQAQRAAVHLGDRQAHLRSGRAVNPRKFRVS